MSKIVMCGFTSEIIENISEAENYEIFNISKMIST